MLASKRGGGKGKKTFTWGDGQEKIQRTVIQNTPLSGRNTSVRATTSPFDFLGNSWILNFLCLQENIQYIHSGSGTVLNQAVCQRSGDAVLFVWSSDLRAAK